MDDLVGDAGSMPNAGCVGNIKGEWLTIGLTASFLHIQSKKRFRILPIPVPVLSINCYFLEVWTT